MSQNYSNKYGTNYHKEFDKRNYAIFGWYICAYCGKLMRKNTVTRDHVLPKSRLMGNKLWDANKSWNLAPCCSKCNSSKSNTIDGRVLQGMLTARLGVVGTLISLAITRPWQIFKVLGLLFLKVITTIFKLVGKVWKIVPKKLKIVLVASTVAYVVICTPAVGTIYKLISQLRLF